MCNQNFYINLTKLKILKFIIILLRVRYATNDFVKIVAQDFFLQTFKIRILIPIHYNKVFLNHRFTE